MRIKGKKIDPNSYDEAAVLRLMCGERMKIKPRSVDFQEAIIRLARKGYSDGQIAHLVNKTRIGVMRIRGRRGVAPAIPRFSSDQSLRVHGMTRPRSMR